MAVLLWRKVWDDCLSARVSLLKWFCCRIDCSPVGVGIFYYTGELVKEIPEAELTSSKGNSDLVPRLNDRCLYLRDLCKYAEDRKKQEKEQKVQDVGETSIRRGTERYGLASLSFVELWILILGAILVMTENFYNISLMMIHGAWILYCIKIPEF